MREMDSNPSPQMYRFIYMSSNGTVVAETYQNFLSAYRRCIPDVPEDYTVRLANATQMELDNQDNNGQPVLVSWNTPLPGAVINNNVSYRASWVQRINNGMVGIFPMLVMPQDVDTLT